MKVKRPNKLFHMAMVFALMLLVSARPNQVTTLFVIGDSTAANKDISGGKQERGWGMALQCFFDPDYIRVDNHAMNGRSSKSFIDEGRWQKVLEKIQPGDYVIIQFGHNDEKPKPDRHTDPGTTFDDNLIKFVSETREHGGIPILMNSVVRREWASAASETEADSLIDTHGLYRIAPRNVAQQMNCHFVDANQITRDLEQGLGPEGSKRLHMWFLPGEEPSLPDGRQDDTHYNVYGAHQVARLLADALCQEVPVLKKYRVDADVTIDRQGRGDYLSLDEALRHIDPLSPCTLQLLGGEWERPALPKKQRLTFVLREGAQWKK